MVELLSYRAILEKVMADNEDIVQQETLLATYRRSLALYLEQLAQQGGAYATPALLNGITEARENIRRIKTGLRKRGVKVEDFVNDQDLHYEHIPSPSLQPDSPVTLNSPMSSPSSALDHAHLPNKAYSRLWGRISEVEKIVEVLQNPTGRRVTVISGLGGIGKTALAREIADVCQQGKIFDEIIWETAQAEQFIGGEIRPFNPTFTSPETLLLNIALHLGHSELVSKSHEKRKEQLKSTLEQKRCLIVVDNLESIEDNRRCVVDLSEIASKNSSILLTSRAQLVDFDSVYSLTLHGLPEKDAVEFLRSEGIERGIFSVPVANDKDLRQINRAIGGAPLAGKLIVAQLARIPLEVVLINIQQAKGDSERMYTFIYRTAWRLLTNESRKVLLAMTAFAAPANRDAIEYVSDVSAEYLHTALTELVTLSLLETTPHLGITKKRYSLHPLTMSFIRTDLVKKWN
jgi:hypothetical protein